MLTQPPETTDAKGRSWARAYTPPGDSFDEAFASSGAPRPAYLPVLAALDRRLPGELSDSISSSLAREGVRFRTGSGIQAFAVDPLPRLISRDEWQHLERGLIQRCEALNAFVADAYGERRIIEAGAVPERVLTGSTLYEPLMQGVRVPGDTYAHVCGPDLVRDRTGEYRVLEDNLRSPSGLAYLMAARRTLTRELGPTAAIAEPLTSAIGALADALRAAAPPAAQPPHVVLLSDGPNSPAWFEHKDLADRLRIPVVRPEDLSSSGNALVMASGKRSRPVDVVYRRTQVEQLTDPAGELTPLGALLWEPIKAGSVGVVNAFGTGVADDKLAHAYVEEMIRFFLGEEPLVKSVPTLDLADPSAFRTAMDRIDNMVIKDRFGLGGEGVTICSEADPAAIDRVLEAVHANPAGYVAQERIDLSTHPTLAGESLEPRHVDLRPYVIRTSDGYSVVPGGLTRYAAHRGSLVVNSSQGGGGKDTWVVK